MSAEENSAVGKPAEEETWWDRRGDLATTFVLASVTLLLAWSGFQASKWGGVQAINFSDAGKARTDSNALTDLGATAVSIDVSLFVSWLEVAEPELTERNGAAATTGEGLAPFLYQSFPDRLQVAVDDWLVQNARGDGDVPLPFELDSYVVESFVRAQQLRDDAADFGEAARQNNQQSDIYVLATVVFAAALFLVGVCQKLNRQKFQQAVFIVAVVVALVGAFIVVTQPIEFVTADIGL